ncbi:MAG: toxin-antitoxin system HicB family antitoxin [Chloroflexota bacterium]|nr:toxin-antitoxin system HicB family antitoxin [Chloroflexota bacterium]
MMTMPNYTFQVFWSKPDEAYIATCTEFPLLSAFADTSAKALEELNVALELAVEGYEEEGWPLPMPQERPVHSGQLRVRLPKTLHSKLAAQADIEAISLNTLIVTYLAEGLAGQNVRPKAEKTVVALFTERDRAN